MSSKAEKLIDFIDKSPSVYHVVKNIEDRLIKENFTKLSEGEKWDLEANKGYFVKKNDSALIAFKTGEENVERHGFRLSGSHTDSPTFKIKPNPEMLSEDTYIKLNTEVYGGGILSTWFDRPLSIAGRVMVKGDNPLNPKTLLVDIEKPLLIIPNLAIHLNRKVNEGIGYERQNDILPLLGFINEKINKNDYILNIISKKLDISKNDILDMELFLYDSLGGGFIGNDDELINIGKLDDLWMVQSTLEGFINSGENSATKVAVFLNNEEIGNNTAEGADSDYLRTILRRICIGLGKNTEEFFIALNNSIMISADLAHGVHPNFSNKHDPTNRPLLGGGPVLKYSAAKKYSTDGLSAAIFARLCQQNNIPYQKFLNHSDIVGGSTMGPSFAVKLSIPVIDMGAAILSMHSIRETAATKDIETTEKLFEKFFEL